MKIQQLSPGVVTKIRSDIAFTSIAHCVEELVLNSIDASATCIAVNLNLPLYQIQVIDNGCGIDVEGMKIIGTRYATSKCHSLKDLQNLKSGGFRGEALSSLKEVSSVLVIESRATSSTETFCKIFTQGKSADPKKSLNSRPSKGTSVSVYDFMYNLPVRKKCILDALDFEECRKLLQRIALMHPYVSFTLKNEATGEMCLQLKKCSSLYNSFLQIFGKSKTNNLKNIDYQRECYEVNGCISTDCHISKDLQFLYVNKRHVLHTKLHKLINNILNKALSSKQKSNVNVNSVSSDTSGQPNVCKCIFVLNISCPYDKYDIIFDPRKTVIEFSEWDSVLKVVEDALIDFLKRENLYSNNEKNELNSLNLHLVGNVDTSNFDVQDCRGLFSHVAHRNFVGIDANKYSATDKSLENIKVNSEESNYNASDKSICNILQENIPSEIPNKSTNTSVKFSFMQGERNSQPSRYQDICHKRAKLSIHMPGACEYDMEKTTNSKISENCLPSTSREFEFDIPCRTVFPSENPVMLRVPTKSILSDLQNDHSSSNFHKFKEKIQCFVRKEKSCPLIKSKHHRKHEKVSAKFNGALEKLLENESLKNSPNLSFDTRKYEAKLKEFCQGNFMNKSSQCSSVSSYQKIDKDQGENVTDAQIKQMSITTTKDKSLQCPSLTFEKPRKIISRFEFKEDSVILPLKHLKKSKRFHKNFFKSRNDDLISISENSFSRESKGCISEKLKSSHNNSDITNCIPKENKSVEGAIDEFSEEHGNNFHNMFAMQNILESCSQSPAIFNTFETEESKITNLNDLESSFCLQTFIQTKHQNNCVQNVEIFTELEKFSSKKGELLLENNDNIDNVNIPRDQVNYLQKFSPRIKSKENVSCVNEIEKVDSDFKEGLQGFTIENIHTEFKISKEDISCKNNGIYSKVASPNLTDLEHFLHNNSSSLDNENDLFSLQTESCLGSNNIIESVEMEYIDFKAQHEVFSNSSVASHDAEKSNNLQSDNDVLSLLAEMKKAVCDIDFESNPFTESLPLSSENMPLKINSLQKNDSSGNENTSNSLSQEISDLSDKNVEIPSENEKNCNSSYVSGLNNITLHPCSSVGLSCIQNDYRMTNSEFVSSVDECDSADTFKNNSSALKSKSYNQWKVHLEPNLKRKIYVDKVTGNSSYISPKVYEVDVNQKVQSIDGTFKKSHFFLTHDYSPFISKTQSPENNLKIHSHIQNDLKNFVINNEKNDWYTKWRISKENFEYNDNNLENMLIAWKNPMFDMPYEVDLADKISHNASQIYSFLSSYRFSKDTLNSLQVIGQVDCKFIACILKNYNENSRDERLLALFDQHAVHERIRLEELIEDLYETDKNGEKSVKTVVINQPLQVTFSDEEIRLLHSYHEKLHKIGIHINIDSNSHAFCINSIPPCLVYRKTGQLRRSVSDSITILQNVIIEWLSTLVKTRSVPHVLPKALLSVLNYQACRGAVKFGDPLTLEECTDLLRALSNCKLPFQCAHGRPSIAPILDLKKIEGLYKKKSPPQLGTLIDKLQE